MYLYEIFIHFNLLEEKIICQPFTLKKEYIHLFLVFEDKKYIKFKLIKKI